MLKSHVLARLIRSMLLPVTLLVGLLEVFQTNYLSLKILYALLGGVLIVVPLCLYALLYVRNHRLKWWVTLWHFVSTLLIGAVLSVLVLIGLYYLPHGKWLKTNAAPESISRIEVLPNSIEPGILTLSSVHLVYRCQADEGSKIRCTWVEETGEKQSYAASVNEMTLAPYRFYAPILLRKPIEAKRSYRLFADAMDTARFVRFDDRFVHYWVRMWNSYAIFIRAAFALLIGLVAGINISISLPVSIKKSSSVQQPKTSTKDEV